MNQVYVVFKTHLDVGYTDLSSKVTQCYIKNFIPKALDVAEQLRKENARERYVWTTGAWLIWEYLHKADPQAVKRLEKGIREGDIVWNGMPYSLESETLNEDLFRALLLPVKELDRRYGKKTIAAKMTDVPGHTRSIIPPLADAGIKFLHIGVNPGSPVAEIPPICRWRDRVSGKEVILVIQASYGAEQILPDGKTVIAICFTGDNHGPHSYKQVKQIFSRLHEKYPNAELTATSLNTIAEKLCAMRDKLPVLTSEIGDTWVYGYASNPQRMRQYRALLRLFSRWVAEKRLDFTRDETLSFILDLGQISEHTQGADVKKFIKNWDKYDPAPFTEARKKGVFDFAEKSWREKSDYMKTAIAKLPPDLRQEAESVMAKYAPKKSPSDLPEKAVSVDAGQPLLTHSLFGGSLNIPGLNYRLYDMGDYNIYLKNFARLHLAWTRYDFGKPGLEKSKAVSSKLPARVISKSVVQDGEWKETRYLCGFNIPAGIDPRILPKRITLTVREHRNGKEAQLDLTLFGKPAVRYPEAYWFTFDTAKATGLIAEKVGEPVDLSDVVKKGSRTLHGIDRYADIVRADGTFRIFAQDAFLIGLGKNPGLNFSTEPVKINEGLHFNLLNNLWGTNFCMWNEGNLTYRFTVKKIK